MSPFARPLAAGFLGLALLAGALAYRFRSGAWRHIELVEPSLV